MLNGSRQMIDEKTAKAVRALAQFGNSRAAAEMVGTSPASFSRSISQAEAYVGHSLFERGGKSTSLTQTGKEFLQLLDELYAANSSFEAGVSKLRSVGPEVLNIGCGPLSSRTVIAPLMAELLREMPNLRARIDVRATKEPLEGLRMSRLDVVVCDLTHTPDLSDLDIQMLRKEPISFCARPEHPLHRSESVHLAELFQHAIMSPHVHRHWQEVVASALGGDQPAWKIVERLPQIECDDFSLVTDLACRTNLICAVMSEDIAQHVKLKSLKQIKTVEKLTWNICAARRKNVGFPALDIFWARLCDQFGAT